MSLRRKLLLSYGLLVLGMLGIGGWSIYHFAVLGRSVRLIMSRNYRSVVDAQIMKEALERQDSAMMFHVAGHDDKAMAQRRAERQAAAATRATVTVALGTLLLGVLYAVNLSTALAAPQRKSR